MACANVVCASNFRCLNAPRTPDGGGVEELNSAIIIIIIILLLLLLLKKVT